MDLQDPGQRRLSYSWAVCLWALAVHYCCVENNVDRVDEWIRLLCSPRSLIISWDPRGAAAALGYKYWWYRWPGGGVLPLLLLTYYS